MANNIEFHNIKTFTKNSKITSMRLKLVIKYLFLKISLEIYPNYKRTNMKNSLKKTLLKPTDSQPRKRLRKQIQQRKLQKRCQ